MKNILKNSAVLIAVLLICAAVGIIFGCPIKRVTGLPCPGCGMTRSCLALLRLNFREMLLWHPLAPLVPFIGITFILRDTSAGKKIWSCTPLWAGLIILVMGTYIIRMKLYFPNIPPTNLEENSLIVKILHKILLQ